MLQYHNAAWGGYHRLLSIKDCDLCIYELDAGRSVAFPSGRSITVVDGALFAGENDVYARGQTAPRATHVRNAGDGTARFIVLGVDT